MNQLQEPRSIIKFEVEISLRLAWIRVLIVLFRPRGRAAAKKAANKTKTDLEDMSNLGKKKRRPR